MLESLDYIIFIQSIHHVNFGIWHFSTNKMLNKHILYLFKALNKYKKTEKLHCLWSFRKITENCYEKRWYGRKKFLNYYILCSSKYRNCGCSLTVTISSFSNTIPTVISEHIRVHLPWYRVFLQKYAGKSTEI